jgi:hypothetical protein
MSSDASATRVVSISCYFQNAQLGNLGYPWVSLGNFFRKQGAQKWLDRTAYLACYLGDVLETKDLEDGSSGRTRTYNPSVNSYATIL